MRLFSKPDKKSKKPSSDEDTTQPAPSPRSSPRKSTTSSPSRPRPRDENHNHQPAQGSPRSSRRFPKPSSRHLDPNTHPLNLPPDQLQKRLSALSASSASSTTMPDAMDVDSEAQNTVPTSPPQTNMPGSFSTPKTNSASANANGDGPVPPPHRSNPTSPASDGVPTPEQAEAFKTAGNKFYKAKEYKKAIEEYTKGRSTEFVLVGQVLIFPSKSC